MARQTDAAERAADDMLDDVRSLLQDVHGGDDLLNSPVSIVCSAASRHCRCLV